MADTTFDIRETVGEATSPALPRKAGSWRLPARLQGLVERVSRLPRLPGRFAPIGALMLFAAAVWTIHKELGRHGYHSIAHSLAHIGALQIAEAIAMTVISLGCLLAGEHLAGGMIGKRLKISQVWRPALTAYSLGNALGFSFATAPMARSRLYRGLLTPGEVGALSAITGASVMIGAASATGLGLVIGAGDIAHHGMGAAWLWRAVGLILLGPLAIAIWTCLNERRDLAIGGVTISSPRCERAGLQAMAGVGDWTAAAGVLYLLLPGHGGWSFPAFVAVFVASGLLGAVSGSPGGLGVFEAAILALSPVSSHVPGAAAALVVYRLVYTIAPLGVAALVLGQDIVAPKGSVAQRAASRLADAARDMAPKIFAALAFASGAVLLLSSATPALTHRLQFLSAFAPLALVEASHFLASLTAVLLLVVAAALWRRLQGAYYAALALLGAGAVFALFKGLDFEEAIVLALVALALLPCRQAFTRQSTLLSQPLGPGWIAAVIGSVAAAGWLGFMAYRHVGYSNDLWWTFLEDAQASRFLRGAAGVAILTILVSAWALLTPPRARGQARPSTAEIERAAAAIEGAEGGHADAHLALMGDKDLVFSASGRTFLMFRRRGARWIALSEPCGIRAERREVLWRFMEMADEAAARPIFYSISDDMLADVADLGLAARKIGEKAIVPVSAFSLDGKRRAGLRNVRNRIEREGASFEVLPPGSASSRGDQLRAISNEWLADHEGAEKQFSLGNFDLGYLDRTPLAVIRYNGTIVAFANVWTTPDRSELSIDLMRYGATAPRNVMDFLFVKLIEWGKTNGYREFDLGMAPLAGLDTHRLAPAFSRIGAAVYEEGEQLYGFRGLRAYKEKFDPDWRPIYIAVPPGMSVASAMLDVALLTSGGVGGLFS